MWKLSFVGLIWYWKWESQVSCLCQICCHPFLCLERKLRKEHLFMSEVILETHDLNEALISAKTCVSHPLCDSLWCSSSDMQNAFALAPADGAKGYLFRPSGRLWSANRWEKWNPGALKFILHLSFFFSFNRCISPFFCETWPAMLPHTAQWWCVDKSVNI